MLFQCLFWFLALAPHLAFGAKSKEEIDLNHQKTAAAFYEGLSLSERQSLSELLKKIVTSESSLTRISTDETKVNNVIYLYIQGLEFLEQDQWEPITILRQSNHISYFFHWSKNDSIQSNQDKLKKSISSLLESHPQNEIVVFGFSAGGVLALLAWDQLMFELTNNLFTRLTLRNIVAVPHGYGASRMARVASLFVGKTTILIGMGIDEKLKNKLITRCEQWITTDGDLDIHARDNKDGRSPQILTTAACGEDHLHRLPLEGHFSALSSVLRKSISEDDN